MLWRLDRNISRWRCIRVIRTWRTSWLRILRPHRRRHSARRRSTGWLLLLLTKSRFWLSRGTFMGLSVPRAEHAEESTLGGSDGWRGHRDIPRLCCVHRLYLSDDMRVLPNFDSQGELELLQNDVSSKRDSLRTESVFRTLIIKQNANPQPGIQLQRCRPQPCLYELRCQTTPATQERAHVRGSPLRGSGLA